MDPRASRIALACAAAVLLLHTASDWRARPVPVSSAPPAKSAQSPKPPTPQSQLAQRKLAVPVQGVAPSRLRDTYTAQRSKGRTHEAIDIMAAWGTPVVAADDGTILKVSRNNMGGLTLFQADASGRFVYYYAHLAGYADNLHEGQQVKRGDVIAYVGATGNAPKDAPHLHFAVMLKKPSLRWQGAEVLNPYPALAAGGGDDPEVAQR